MSTTRVTWGGQVLDVVDLTTRRSRTFIDQVPARGRGGTFSDRGPDVRECRAQVRWIKRHAGDDPRARLRALLALDDGKTRLFQHPVDGEFPAKMSLEDESQTAAATSTNVRFVEDRGDGRSTDARAPATVASAIEQVLVSARTAESTLDAHSLATDVAADTAALARSWDAPDDSTPADVETGVNRQTAAIRASLDDSGASGDPARLDVYFALLDMSAALAQAAESVNARDSSTHGLVTLELHEPVTLLALCSRLYGATHARERTDQILRLNPMIRNASAVPAHLTLTVPSV